MRRPGEQSKPYHPIGVSRWVIFKPITHAVDSTDMGTNAHKTTILVTLMLALVVALFAAPAQAASRDPKVKGSGAGFSATEGPSSARTTATGGALPEFGTQFHGMWSSYTDSQRAMVLDVLKANGVTTVRLDVSWAMLSPDGPTWNAAGTQKVARVIDMITDRGLAPMVMIWMTPSWVTGSTDERVAPSSPSELRHWQNFTQELAARFPQVRDWEIWNEPNSDDFMRGADATVYAKLLDAAYKGIKSGNPAARVIFGGTQYVDTPWIVSALKAGAQGRYDIMGVHPYMAVGDLPPTSPDTDGIWRMSHLPTLREAMLKFGDDKPIWFTEFGWRVGSVGTENGELGVSESTQAKYLAETLRLVSTRYSYVTRVFWYRDLADNNSSTSSGYGLVQPNGTPKPALSQIPALYSSV
ncbi:MAG TPA: cellulase family glycosylhydrolase [Actinomycetota bacterium]|nr:cellulase family glycosylhydrolase [Actinomycetota bacterium]